MSDRTSAGRKAAELNVSPQFDAYSRVVITIGEDDNGDVIQYISGTDSGRTLELTTPWGSQAMADNILSQLQTRNFRYQPFSARTVQVDPSAELGDGITIDTMYSGIYSQDLTFSTLMASDVEAPEDEEIEHEFPYIPKTDREYRRTTARLNSRITQTAEQIELEVIRATDAESTLSSLISQTATGILAEVVKQEDGNTSSFGWKLLSTGWELYSGSKTVLKATSSGIEVTGKITATSGYIGNGSSGFTIGSKAIYNGVTSMTDTAHNGIYLGTDGIRLGKGVFNVNNAGKLTASNVDLTGKITASSGAIGGFIIGSSAIYSTGKTSYSSTADGIFMGSSGLSIGEGFRVDKEGNLNATSGTFAGSVNAGNIQYSSTDSSIGTFSGAGLSSGSVGSGRLASAVRTDIANGVYAYDVVANKVVADDIYTKRLHVMNSKLWVLNDAASWQSVTVDGSTLHYLGR